MRSIVYPGRVIILHNHKGGGPDPTQKKKERNIKSEVMIFFKKRTVGCEY
jgi:hypothetical protein